MLPYVYKVGSSAATLVVPWAWLFCVLVMATMHQASRRSSSTHCAELVRGVSRQRGAVTGVQTDADHVAHTPLSVMSPQEQYSIRRGREQQRDRDRAAADACTRVAISIPLKREGV